MAQTDGERARAAWDRQAPDAEAERRQRFADDVAAALRASGGTGREGKGDE